MAMYAEKIKELRKKLGLSVPKLAERIGIPARTIVSYESGRTPSLDFVAQLCNIFDIDANWFVSGKGEMFIKKQPVDLKEQIRQTVEEMLEERLPKNKME